MDYVSDTDYDVEVEIENNEISETETNVKIYQPEELNRILLCKTREIAYEYFELKIIGDIINFKRWRKGGCSFDLTMNNQKVSCKVFTLRSAIYPDDVQNYINTKCIITGRLEAEYFYGHKFSINVCSISIQNDDTKLKELKSICEARGYFKNKKNVDWNSIKNIGIISKKNTQGYNDFCNQFKIPIDIKLQQITLEGPRTCKECIEAIQKLQNVDAICIIRGGGDTGEISSSFDRIELFDVIKNSEVPIITAIGHEQDKDDKLLITNVSDIDFPTPTSLAKDLNQKFNEPLFITIDNLLDSNEELFYKLIEKTNNKLYKALTCFVEDFLRNKFGGLIVELNNNEMSIIIKKDSKYYHQKLSFDNQLEFTDYDIELRDSILDALDCKEIDIIKDNFEKLNTNKHKLTSNIQDNIKKIIKNNNIEDKFNGSQPNKIKEYYLKSNYKTSSLKKIIKIREMLLWYKQKIEESINGKDINEIKEIFNFIKNTI